MISSRNYRVVREDDWLAVWEVYYDEKGRVACRRNPAVPWGETLSEVKTDLALIRRALSRPVLQAKKVRQENNWAYGDWKQWKKEHYKAHADR